MSLQTMAQGGNSTLPSSNLRINLRPEVLSFLIVELTKEYGLQKEKNRVKAAAWRAANPELLKARRVGYGAKYREANREEIRAKGREYMEERRQDPEFKAKENEEQTARYWEDIERSRAKNRTDAARAAKKKWKLENPEKVSAHRKASVDRGYFNDYVKRRELRDPNFKLRKRLSHRIYVAVKSQDAQKFEKTRDLLGCGWEEFKAHIEALFQLGMTWENYGSWHIDHRLPCASFNLLDPEQQKICFHFTNLQPLWMRDNLSKGAKL